jgi:hypothetical protein
MNTTLRTSAIAVATGLLGFSWGMMATAQDSAPVPTTTTQTAVTDPHGYDYNPTHPAIPACELEDGSTQEVCRWDGGANGKGRSYTVYNYGADVIYD